MKSDSTPFTSSYYRVCPWHVPSTYFPPSTGNRRGVRLDDRISWEPPWEFVATQFANAFRKQAFPLLNLFKFTNEGEEDNGRFLIADARSMPPCRYLFDDNEFLEIQFYIPPDEKILSLYFSHRRVVFYLFVITCYYLLLDCILLFLFFLADFLLGLLQRFNLPS